MKNITEIDRGGKAYRSPSLEVEYVYIEQSIAAGSATVVPVNSANQVQQEWETGEDVSRELLW